MSRLRKAASFLLATACIAAPLPSDSPPPSQGSDEDSGPTFTVSDLPVGRPLRIVVYGDMRFTDPANTSDTHPGVRKWLAQKVGEEKPDILLLTGDMPFHGSNAGRLENLFPGNGAMDSGTAAHLSHHRQP